MKVEPLDEVEKLLKLLRNKAVLDTRRLEAQIEEIDKQLKELKELRLKSQIHFDRPVGG